MWRWPRVLPAAPRDREGEAGERRGRARVGSAGGGLCPRGLVRSRFSRLPFPRSERDTSSCQSRSRGPALRPAGSGGGGLPFGSLVRRSAWRGAGRGPPSLPAAPRAAWALRARARVVAEASARPVPGDGAPGGALGAGVPLPAPAGSLCRGTGTLVSPGFSEVGVNGSGGTGQPPPGRPPLCRHRGWLW